MRLDPYGFELLKRTYLFFKFGVVFAARSEAELALYVYHGALAGTATLLPILALAPRVRSRALVLGAFIWGALVYPIQGNWVWGGGWLANLGRTLNLGHGTVDYAGALTVFLFGGLSALLGILYALDERDLKRLLAYSSIAHAGYALIEPSAVGIYNDFTGPLYFLPGSQNVTAPLTLFSFISQFSSQWNLLFADVVFITIPPLIMFMFFQRQIVSGMTAGAVRG